MEDKELDAIAEATELEALREAELESDFQGKTFDLSKYGFKAAAEYLFKLEVRYGRMFVPARYNKDDHTIYIHYDDSV